MVYEVQYYSIYSGLRFKKDYKVCVNFNLIN